MARRAWLGSSLGYCTGARLNFTDVLGLGVLVTGDSGVHIQTLFLKNLEGQGGGETRLGPCVLLLGGVASQPTEGGERDWSRFPLDPVEQQQDDPLLLGSEAAPLSTAV